MKHKLLKLLYTALFATSCLAYAYDDEAEPLGILIVEQKAPVVPNPFIEYHNRMSVFGINQGYERIKPNALYVGIEGWGAYTFADHHTLLGETEFRMGYNFFYNGRDHFTPLLGVGFVKDLASQHIDKIVVIDSFYYIEKDTVSRPGIIYGTLGFLYDHEFNTVFNLGLNMKALFGAPENRKHFDWGSYVVGYDLSIPITFRFGRHRHWDYRLEFFDLYLHGEKEASMYYGLRNSIGYRF